MGHEPEQRDAASAERAPPGAGSSPEAGDAGPLRPAGEPLLGTGEVMERSGLSRQVLYQYTAMGLIREAGTTSAGYRLYPARTLRHLELIRRLNEVGYTLRDIKDIFFRRAHDPQGPCLALLRGGQGAADPGDAART